MRVVDCVSHLAIQVVRSAAVALLVVGVVVLAPAAHVGAPQCHSNYCGPYAQRPA